MSLLLIIFLSSLSIILIMIVRKYIKSNFDKVLFIAKKNLNMKQYENFIKNKIIKMDIANNKINKLSYNELITNAENALKDNAYNNAEKYFISALGKKNYKNSTTILKSLAYIYFKKNLFRDAIKTYSKLNKKNRLEPNEYFNLGFSYYKLGKLEDAELNFIEALSLEPTNLKYIKHISDIYLIQRKYSKLEYILNAYLEEENNIDILHQLAELYELTDDKEKLKNTYEEILRQNKDNILIKRKLKKLK